MTVWIDVEDLFQYARAQTRPSGIQRLSFEMYRAMRELAGDGGVRFLRHDPGGRAMRTVGWDRVTALYQGMTTGAGRAPPAGAAPRADGAPALAPIVPTSLRALVGRVPERVRAPAGRAARAQAVAAREALAALRAAWAPAGGGLGETASSDPMAPRPAPEPEPLGEDLRDLARPGDVLAALGSPWFHPDYPALVRAATGGVATRFALMVYDLIPLVRPEFCDPGLISAFRRFFAGCLPVADAVMTISCATARDVSAWAAREGSGLRSAPRPVPIGTGFGDPGRPFARAATTPLPDGLERGRYALFVSTIEARKNHALAFRAWRRLLEELGPDRVPSLVFAGRVGWMVEDLMRQIANSGALGGKVVLVDSPDDALLAALYEGARFTLFPSLYEGWGLPVSESLAFGRVCLASNTSSVPEAGGGFCLYHDPDSVTEATALYRRAIDDDALLKGLEARIARDYAPVPWRETARAVLAAVA